MIKFIRETKRLYSKITDKIFLTENFHKYQMKYSGSYSNSYKLEKNQICLIHPPKSAGTSLNVHLKKNNVFIYESAHCLVSRFCSTDKYKYIIIIRNPINRIKSFYEMQLNNKKLAFHNHAKKGFDFFIKKLKINQNCICKFILGDLKLEINENNYEYVKKKLNEFWFILDFENLEEDVKMLSKKLNIPSNMEHLGKKENFKQTVLNEENIKIIRKFNEYDLKIFDYFINNFKK